MRTSLAAVTITTVLLIASGCATSTKPAPKAKASATKPAATAASKPAAPAATAPVVSVPQITAPEPAKTAAPEAPVVAPKLSPEAAALIERLTTASAPGTLPHEMSESTSFPGAMVSLEPGAAAPKIESAEPVTNQPPAKGLTADGNTTQLVERDWTGLVLVPISTSLSKAYTSDVRLTKVEAHPLNDGRVRIWTRVHNVGPTPLPAEIACEFRMKGSQASSPYFYQLDVPGDGYRDVFFVSPDGTLNAYTVLVRSSEAVQR
ncbi:hypothetical protein DB347_21385 [Opitutaceae bacterium EW11]|nr:hypothetical protein DB347_21385 [Opitutaceae bacterium EW11]